MIKQKTALVTGGSRGIGKAIALKLLAEDYFVCTVGTKAYEETNHGEFDPYPNFLYIKADISQSTGRTKIIKAVLDRCGRLDLLVNNAGVGPNKRADLLEMTEESFDYVNNINLKGTFFLTQLAAKVMLEQKETLPIIINISSMSAYTSSINRGEYCISKAGISMMTKLFADRLADDGILVYEIKPGIIKTDMTETVKDKYEALIKGGITPIKRWGTPEDVAEAVSVLASHKLGFSTGEVINVDGGFHLRRL